MEWTTEKRYLPYNQWDAATLLKLRAQAARSPYQLKYHFHSPSGLINDPNGFSYFDGKWHLFYQHYPFGAVHGLKSWGHLVSDDLVHWDDLGTAITPDTKFDSHGAYSGSARVIDGRLLLMYTGNHRDENWKRIPYQIGAWMDKDNTIHKLDKPFFLPPDHVTEHFRDPQLIKQHDNYFVLLGAQDKATETGKISVFRSHDLHKFEDLGYLDFTDDDMGYMIECPNLVWVDDHPVLIFCPQGLDKKVAAYENIYPNMYVIGDDVNLDVPSFSNAQALTNFDDGFDVYATQAFNAPDGQTYAVSWVGLPDVSYPTDDENWAGCYTQVKQLHLKDGRLIQRPVPAMADLRHNGQTVTATTRAKTTLLSNVSHQGELKLQIPADQVGTLNIVADRELKHSLAINFATAEDGQLTVDRANVGKAFAEEYGTTRSIALPAHQQLELDIFWDASLCEIFVNGGEHVLTLRYFAADPVAQSNVFLTTADQPVSVSGTYWEMKH